MEWVNVVWLASVLLWLMPAQRELAVPADTWQRALSFVPVTGLLLVGGWYWHRKLHQVRDGRRIDDALRILDRLEGVFQWS